MELHKLFPWFNKEESDMKDKRTDEAVRRGKEVESHVRVLAENYKAAGLILQKAKKTSA